MGITRMMGATVVGTVFCWLGAFGNPETLVLRNWDGTRIVEVEINYDKYPKTEPPAGRQWSDFDQDTAWTDENSMTYVRYHRVFRARMDGVEGLGYDFIHFDGNEYGGHYTGLFGFNFNDGIRYQQFGADGPHLRENPKLPVANKLVAVGSTYFIHDTYQLPDWTYGGMDYFLLVDRYPGWGQGSAADPQAGMDIVPGRNGKAKAPPRGFFPPMRR